MTFEQFLGLRLPDLVRFAVTLCGNRAIGDQLVDAGVRHTYQAREQIEDPDDAFAELRAWVVRGYLSEGMELGRGPATDADLPIVDESRADSDWDDLTARFVTSSKLQRAVATLRYAEHLDVAGIATAIGSTAEGIELYLRRVFLDLNIRDADGFGSTAAEPNTEDDIRSLLELYGDDVDPDVSRQSEALIRSLPEARSAAAERVEAERVEAERVEAERVEAERTAPERAEREAALAPIAKRAEARRVDRERKAAARAARTATRQTERERPRRGSTERDPAESANDEAADQSESDPSDATNSSEVADTVAVAAVQETTPVTSARDASDAEIPVEASEPAAAEAGGEVTSPSVSESLRGRHRRRITIGLIAVLAILTVGIVVLVGRDSASSTAASDGSFDTLGLPSPVVRPLPGTTVVAKYSGTGTKTLDAGAPRVDKGRQLALNVVCAGEGSLTVGPIALGNCTVPIAADARGLSRSALRVVAPATMKWRIAFTDQPDTGTNGALANPPDPVLSEPDASDVIAAKNGTGDETIKLKRGDGKASGPVRIALTCHGDGVTLHSDAKFIDGKYARSCFSGWSYDFDIHNVKLPTSFTVNAGDGTTWNLVAVRR